MGFLDALRLKNANRELYTYWNQRAPQMRKTNRGWRIDYFLIANTLEQNVIDCKILPDIMGSDHCPISLALSFT